MPLIATQRYADRQTIVPKQCSRQLQSDENSCAGRGVADHTRASSTWRIRNSTQELSALVDNPKVDADDVASMVYDGRNGIVGRWA